jgi:hypothetical protein
MIAFRLAARVAGVAATGSAGAELGAIAEGSVAGAGYRVVRRRGPRLAAGRGEIIGTASAPTTERGAVAGIAIIRAVGIGTTFLATNTIRAAVRSGWTTELAGRANRLKCLWRQAD